MKRFIRENRGQALVEFALVLPALILLLLGIMEFGRVFASYLELQNVARDGVRYAAVHSEITDMAILRSNTKDYVYGRLAMLNPDVLLDPANFSLDLRGGGQDYWLELKLKYQLEINTPVISSIIGNPFELESKMSMRKE